MDDMLSDFVVESLEGLDLIDHNLVVLEADPDDARPLTEIFRALHTIKGSCGFLGFDDLERAAHAGENLLSRLRDGDLAFDRAIADALLTTADTIRDMMASIERTGSPGSTPVDRLVAHLDALTDGTSPPPLTERVHEVDQADAPQSSSAPEDAETESTDETTAEPPPEQSEVGLGGGAGANFTESTIRVDVGLLDRLMNLVGELVLSRNEMLRLVAERDDPAFVAPSQRLNHITSELQEGIMKTRMQPVNAAWTKFPRIVRDLSQQLGKEVAIEVIGKETELDRTIIEAIKDPLTHLVRNTLDHGIEPPHLREEMGKRRVGTLTLSARHQGEQVCIEIADDGRGIDPEKIKAKAIDRGMIDVAEAEALTDQELVNLIFKPGFSTATAVTNISGRGVGMDVVKNSIERIGGSVVVRSDLGRGTRFIIKIPLTLAIIPALTVSCGYHRVAIPQVNLVELLRLRPGSPDKIEYIQGAAVYRLREKLLPIVFLHGQLGVDEPEAGSTTTIVVVRADGLEFGLVVDDVEENGEIVVKPLGRHLHDTSFFSGATILGDGAIALIIDLVDLANRAGVSSVEARTRAAEQKIDADGPITDADVDAASMLLVGVGGDQRVAVVLDDVERLEEIAATALENSNGRPVVQYRGAIMPIIDLGGATGTGTPVLGTGRRLSIVVCLYRGAAVGLAVSEVHDIIDQSQMGDTDQPNTVIIDGRVTDILSPDEIIVRSIPALAKRPHPDPSLPAEDPAMSEFESSLEPVWAQG